MMMYVTEKSSKACHFIFGTQHFTSKESDTEVTGQTGDNILQYVAHTVLAILIKCMYKLYMYMYINTCLHEQCTHKVQCTTKHNIYITFRRGHARMHMLDRSTSIDNK